MGEQIRVGVMTAPREIEVRHVRKPEPGPGEILVRIEACAICTTEQRLYSGVQSWDRFPYVGGHEAAGVVEAFGPGVETDLEVGDRVALFSATCGYCENCRRGRTSKCAHREGFWEHEGLWGTWGFADYKAVKPRGLQRLDSGVPFELGALAEPISCVVHSVRKSPVEIGDYAVVIGAGAMGLLNALILKARGAVVIVLDLQQSRCDKALDVGADVAFVPNESTLEKIEALTQGGPDFTVVASSARAAYDLGLATLAPFSRFVAFSSLHPRGETGLDLTELHREETQLLGTVSSDIEDMRITGRVLSHDLISVRNVVECVMSFDQLEEGMERALQPGSYRVVMRM